MSTLFNNKSDFKFFNSYHYNLITAPPKIMKYYRYPLQIWLTSVFIGPKLTFVLFNYWVTSKINFSTGYWKLYFLALLVGIVLTCPFFFFTRFCYITLLKNNKPLWFTKMTLSLIGLFSCIALFWLVSLTGISNFWSYDNLFMIISYSLPLFIGIYLYKIDSAPFNE